MSFSNNTTHLGRARPTVTIAIPTRNRRGFLEKAIESALAAAGPGDQVVVSDNASTDNTASYLEKITDERLTVLRHEMDLGMVGNWNACLGAATGIYFLLLSDDDLLRESSISLLINALDCSEVAFAYGRTQVIDEAGLERTLGHSAPNRESGNDFIRELFGFNRSIYPCATLFRTKDLRAGGGYDYSFGPLADMGSWLGVWSSNPAKYVAFVSDVVASYRTHVNAISTSDLDQVIAGLAAVSSRFSTACGAEAVRGFDRLGAHSVASALRRRAHVSNYPLLAYICLLTLHFQLVLRYGTVDAYWRQALILHDPEAYERQKSQRAVTKGKQI
jgi:glycosyltransferase involved in cell wall biosynthesis